MTGYDETPWLSDVGSRLREERIARGISVEDAARGTRLSVRQLSAIEEGDSSRLPAAVYVRGFVRAYAAFLGLPDPLPRPDETVAGTPPHENGPPRRRSPLIRRIALPGGLLVTMLILSLFYQEPPRKEASKGNLSFSPATSMVLLPRSSHPPVTPPSSLPAEGVEDGEPSPPERPAAILKLKATEDCWLQVTIDDLPSRQYDLKGGDLIEWKGNRVIAIDIGNAGGVEGEFNGAPLSSFGNRGEVVHRIFRVDAPPATE